MANRPTDRIIDHRLSDCINSVSVGNCFLPSQLLSVVANVSNCVLLTLNHHHIATMASVVCWIAGLHAPRKALQHGGPQGMLQVQQSIPKRNICQHYKLTLRFLSRHDRP